MASSIESRPAGTFSGLRSGVWLAFEGAGLLRRESSLWGLAAVPMGLALAAVTTATGLFWTRLDAIHEAWSSLLPVLEAEAWWSWLWVGPGIAFFWLVAWLSVILSFAVALLAALLLANLASAPFLDRLSQKVESIERGAAAGDEEGASSLVGEALRSFLAELKRLLFLATIWLLLSGVGFLIPGAHFVTGPLLVATTVLFLPLDYAGFALDRRRVSFAARRRWLRDQLPTMAGFGGVAFAACLVPGLNLLILPSLVTGGTLLVLRAPPDADGWGRAAAC